jgi:hypothetical protein
MCFAFSFYVCEFSPHNVTASCQVGSVYVWGDRGGGLYTASVCDHKSIDKAGVKELLGVMFMLSWGWWH